MSTMSETGFYPNAICRRCLISRYFLALCADLIIGAVMIATFPLGEAVH